MSQFNVINLLNKCGRPTSDLKCVCWYPLSSSLFNVFGSKQVRYIKPRWLPKAPSKLYLVTGRKRYPPRETAEILRLYHNHKFFLRKIYEFCSNENIKQSDTSQFSAQAFEKEEKDHKELMEYNRKENERVAAIRDNHLATERETFLKEILNFKIQEAENQQTKKEEALEKLSDTEKLVKTFIELEDLEKAILHAIENPVDFNFSIDVDGRVYNGRNTLPHLVDKTTLPVLPVVDDGITTEIM